MKVIIDRLEGEFAVVELSDGRMAQLPRVLVPEGREGDVVNITIDPAERQKREATVQALMNDLFAD